MCRLLLVFSFLLGSFLILSLLFFICLSFHLSQDLFRVSKFPNGWLVATLVFEADPDMRQIFVSNLITKLESEFLVSGGLLDSVSEL
jgi:hypothetical protein